MLEFQRENVVNIESVVPERSLTYLTVNTELRVLKSHDLMRSTVDTLSLEEDPEFNPALRPPPPWRTLIGYDGVRGAVGLSPEPRPTAPAPEKAKETATGILQSKVSVSMVPDTLIFRISVQTESPEKSANIANTIARLYVDGQRDSKFEALDEAMGWLGNRVVELKAELEAAEAEIEDFSAGAAVVSEETLLANTQRLKSMRARQADLSETAAGLRQRVERLTALRANGDFAALAEAVDDPQVQSAASALARSQRNGGPASTTPAHDPALARFDAVFEPWLDGLRADAERAEDQVAAAGRSVSELERQVDAQSGALVKLRQMQREAEATRLIYQSFLGRLKEITVQQGIQQADSRILSLAAAGSRSHPNVRGTVLRAGVAGLVLGLVLIAVRNVLYSAIRTPEEAEAATGTTVLGAIPEDRIQRPDKLIDHVAEKPASGLAEAVRNMRTAIQLSNIDVPPKVVVVTSSVPEEGKSILAAVLAQTAALPGKKVLLLETDLRRRILREYFGVESEAGLISLLSGRSSFQDTVHRDPRTGLDILIADDEKVTPVDFFGSRQFSEFLTAAREHYDLIVLDTPPVLVVPETRVIAQQADALIYAVRWNATKRRMIQTGLDLLRQVHVRVTGLALTRVDRRRMDRYGYYGYGHGSGSRMLQKYYAD